MSSVESVTLLINPSARHGRAVVAGRRAAARLRERELAVHEVVPASAAESRAAAAAAVADRTGALVVAGGDGTIALALGALAGSGTPLGIVPTGTGNDLARAYRLPRGAPVRAADVIADGHLARLDVGRAETADGTISHFGTVLACGFDSLVGDRANRMRWPHGRARYTVAMVAELVRLRPLPSRITLDDGTVVEDDLLLAAVGNTPSYGGGMRICPSADPADGLLELTVVRAMSRRRTLALFPTVFPGRHVSRPEVRTFRTGRVRIESAGIAAYADGDRAGPLPVEVSVLPHAVSLLVAGGSTP